MSTEKKIENPPAFAMTLRDYFAAKGMQAMMASPEFLVVVTGQEAVNGTASELVAHKAYEYADAMLKARNTHDTP